MSGEKIANTVKFQFPAGLPRPTWVEIAGFLKTLDSDATTMEAVYKMGADKSVCIKYTTEAAMHDALQRNKGDIPFKYSSGKSVLLRMLIAGIDIQYVRVFDVPPEVDDDALCAVLRTYGKIHRTLREKFPTGLGLDHLYTGVRGVYMEMKHDVPPALNIGQWNAKIFHDGLKEKCFLCKLEGHRKNSCPTVKVTEKRNHVESGISYAGVVQGGVVVPPNKMETVDDGIIEIIEEEILEQHTEVVEKEEAKVSTPNMDEMDEERLKEIDAAAEQLGLPNFSENIAKLSETIDALPCQNKATASERRAQFATSGSTELRPKKSARKSNKQ